MGNRKSLPVSDAGTLLLNPRGEHALADEGSRRFIHEIQEARHAGFGFLPFIGAGLSAPSGVPIVNELATYLQRCMFLALRKDKDDDRAWRARWHPRTDQWPPFVDRTPYKIRPVDWSRKLLDHVLLDRSDPELPVMTQGYGAAAEWRNALLFLSRLEHKPRNGDRWYESAELKEPLREIVDTCLRDALRDKHPSLGHRMLAVLAGVLRLDLVLTSNFDDLLERAFRAARNPLEVFDVHIGDHLPHWSAVSEVRSLVKLHGHRYSLRADFTLDEKPTELDKRIFVDYLRAGETRREFRKHLLMMGISTKDERVRALLSHAWKELSKGFRVFWLCYSDADIETVKTFTREAEGRSVVLRQPNVGLFLLQMYQTIRKTLPPSGSFFPSVSRLTVPPLPPAAAARSSGNQRQRPSWCEAATDQLKDFKGDFNGDKLIVATSREPVGGLTSACAKLFRDHESSHVCLWLDLNEVSNTDDLFEVLLEAAYFRLGQDHWIPVYRERDERGRELEIARLVNSVDKRWLLFLNARETPGANMEEASAPRTAHLNGWLDVSEGSTGGPGVVSRFAKLLRQLCGPDSPHVSVVLLCRDGTRRAPLLGELERCGLLDHELELKKDMREASSFSAAQVVAQAIVWTRHEPRRMRFLQGLVLMQRPRLLATIWSPAVSTRGGESGDSAEERLDWLDQLEAVGLIRRKAGGFIWMHSPCRQHLRDVLRNPSALRATGVERGSYRKARRILQTWNPQMQAADIHTRLADWYGKVLDSSESPGAVFEAVYHLCQAAQALLEQGATQLTTDLATERLHTAAQLLKTNAFLIQTGGYARGTCRRLEHLRDTLCKELLKVATGALKTSAKLKTLPEVKALTLGVRGLQIACTEVMRAVAREVGEVSKAYLRHRQAGVLLSGRQWTEALDRDCANGKQVILGALDEGLLRSDPMRWLQWLRWSGMLGILSRSYGAAESALLKALSYASAHPKLELHDPSEHPRRERASDVMRRETMAAVPRAQLQGLRVQVVRVLELYVELLLLRDSLAWRLSGSASASVSRKPSKWVKRAELFIEQGLRLVGDIRAKGDVAGFDHAVRANWSACRLLLHRSVCISRRSEGVASGADDALESALGVLGDAEAHLRISDPRRHRSEIAMIELYRAEARLEASERVPIVDGGTRGERLVFSGLCQKLERMSLQTDGRGPAQIEAIREKLLGSGGLAAALPRLRRAKSLVGDGIRFLNRAEPVLRQRRRNTYWTTWFFERRLRSMALSLWASVFDPPGTPIPFLGLEAAAADTVTVVDGLLEDARRMISVDAYRLATIVEAYMSCTKALQACLLRDGGPYRLQSRLDGMKHELAQAVKDIQAVTARRNDHDWTRGRKDQHADMDRDVRDYLAAVERRVKQMVD